MTANVFSYLRCPSARRRPSAVLLVVALAAAFLPLLSDAGRGATPADTPAAERGYWLVAADGGVFSFGDAAFHGSTGDIKLNQPIVGMAAPSTGKGYWFVASDGGIFAFGDARFYGSTGAIKLNRPIVGMAATPSGKGYWLVASDGGIFAFGDAAFYGSTGDIKLNRPIVGMTATPSGKGYWLVASDGGIFAFGDAVFYGSTGDIKLNRPIAGMAPSAGKGYWLVASDGGMFSFGEAPFFGSAAAAGGAEEVVGMVPTPSGQGYWQIGAKGTVFNFGDAPRLGSAEKLNHKVVGAAGVSAVGPVQIDPSVDPTAPGPGSSSTVTTTAPGGGLMSPAQKGKPNVMVVVMDDMRVEGIMDNPQVMPKLKQWLVEGGSTFSEGYATTPLCCPERATIWSGRLSHNHGVYDNDAGDSLDRDWIIPRYMKDAGYRTALVGKFITNWHFATEAEGRYEIPHFDEYAVFQGGYVDVPFRVKNPGDVGYRNERAAYGTDYIGDKVDFFVNAYEANDAQPWYIHVAPHAPHDNKPPTPLYQWAERHNDTPIPAYQPTPAASIEGLDSPTAKQEKADKVQRIRSKTIDPALITEEHDGQLRTLLAADEMIDKIMTGLQAKGELDNTMVIFTSDNGFSLGERGVDSKGWPYREDVNVPFLVRWPGVVAAGVVDPRPVGGEDILPTLLEAAQYTPPQFGHPLDGTSFLPGNAGREGKFLEFGPKPGPTPSTYNGHRGIPSWASIRTADWQYIEYYEASDNQTVHFKEYYDLKGDPWQLQNLLADGNTANDPDVTALAAELAAMRACAGRVGSSACS